MQSWFMKQNEAPLHASSPLTVLGHWQPELRRGKPPKCKVGQKPTVHMCFWIDSVKLPRYPVMVYHFLTKLQNANMLFADHNNTKFDCCLWDIQYGMATPMYIKAKSSMESSGWTWTEVELLKAAGIPVPPDFVPDTRKSFTVHSNQDDCSNIGVLSLARRLVPI